MSGAGGRLAAAVVRARGRRACSGGAGGGGGGGGGGCCGGGCGCGCGQRGVTAAGCRMSRVEAECELAQQERDVCHEPRAPGSVQRRATRLPCTDGGTNFGAPFRSVECGEKKAKSAEKKTKGSGEVAEVAGAAEAAAARAPAVLPPTPLGIQVAILNAETRVGQYLALLLKQTPCFRKLCLYESGDTEGEARRRARDLRCLRRDVNTLDTSCQLECFSACADSDDLDRCLQSCELVLLLDSCSAGPESPLEGRFARQAPAVACYTDAITRQCPKAVVVVAATPVECFVPLVAEGLRSTGWWDERRLLGSLAACEARASSAASLALSLDPRCTRVPCVGGTETDALVPLFSRAVDYFQFSEAEALRLTHEVRSAPLAVASADPLRDRRPDMSEAHALATLATQAALALLCHSRPLVSAFVAHEFEHLLQPCRYVGGGVTLGSRGVEHHVGLPRMSALERRLTDAALPALELRVRLAEEWWRRHVNIAELAGASGPPADGVLARELGAVWRSGPSERLERCLASAALASGGGRC